MIRKRVIEIIGLFPNEYSICWSCIPALRTFDINLTSVGKDYENVPKNVLKEYMKIREIVKFITEEFPGIFDFRFIDAASFLGIWKTIRHKIKKTPCLLLNGRKILEGSFYEDDLVKSIKNILKY